MSRSHPSGSRDARVGSSGQRIDLSIVEVALYFMREISNAMVAAAVAAADDDAAAEGGAPAAPPVAPAHSAVPVILLSNDNGQIAAAKSHGLPAFRLLGGATANEADARMAQLIASGSPVTSSGARVRWISGFTVKFDELQLDPLVLKSIDSSITTEKF